MAFEPSLARSKTHYGVEVEGLFLVVSYDSVCKTFTAVGYFPLSEMPGAPLSS